MERTNYKIDIQKRTYSFSLLVIKFIKHTKLNDNSSKIIINQLIRSATSIGANIAEAQAGSSRKDFRNFLLHALKSANETIYWLRLLKDTNDLDGEINFLVSESGELAKILGKSVSNLR